MFLWYRPEFDKKNLGTKIYPMLQTILYLLSILVKRFYGKCRSELPWQISCQPALVVVLNWKQLPSNKICQKIMCNRKNCLFNKVKCSLGFFNRYRIFNGVFVLLVCLSLSLETSILTWCGFFHYDELSFIIRINIINHYHFILDFCM